MKELISSENIKVNANVRDWKEAIEVSGNLLLISKKIKRNYIDEMIKAVVDMGPYMVIAPGFALAHARPSEAVLENAVSLVTLENPVNFGSENDPVKVIMCVACTDSISHINILRAIAEKLIIEGMIDRIASCQSVQEVYLLINE